MSQNDKLEYIVGGKVAYFPCPNTISNCPRFNHESFRIKKEKYITTTNDTSLGQVFFDLIDKTCPICNL